MRLILSVFTSLICLSVFSQSPEKINYQSIVRDLSGNVIQNQPISLRISILSTSITGSVVYQETFQPTTNDFGLVNIKIGEGSAVVGTMSGVDWSSGPFFLESAVDVSGGSNYTVVSTSQFMSVPYALYANESPLDTNIVQNIVSLQTSNYLDSSAVQNLIDNSSTTNVDSSTVASWSYLDSITIQNLINNSVSNVDSTTIANLGFVAGNTDTQIDSTGIAALGFSAGSTVDTQIDSTGIAALGYVAGPKTIDTDTQLDSAGVAALGYLAGNTDTQIDSAGIANLGYVAGPNDIYFPNPQTAYNADTNCLDTAQYFFHKAGYYALTVYKPKNQPFQIKITSMFPANGNGLWSYGGSSGFKITRYDSNLTYPTQTFTASTYFEFCEAGFDFIQSGNYLFEYFKNNSLTPYISKIVTVAP